MKIVSENIQLKNINTFTTEYIETELRKMNIDPVRWAVIDVNENFFTLCVSHVII